MSYKVLILPSHLKSNKFKGKALVKVQVYEKNTGNPKHYAFSHVCGYCTDTGDPRTDRYVRIR